MTDRKFLSDIRLGIQTVDKVHGERRGFFFAEMPKPQCLSGALALFLGKRQIIRLPVK